MNPTTHPAALPARVKATRREWTGLGVLALACLLYVMDLSVLHLAVPAISADLRPTSTQLLSATASGAASCCSSARRCSAWCRCWPRSPEAPRC
jgi:hypothetical protein